MNQSIKELLLGLNQRPIAYYPIYRKITGSTTAGILLSQIMYWSSTMNGEKFYKTDQEFMDETLLTEKEYRLAKNKIKSLPFIKIVLEGIPAKSYYYVDYDLYVSSLSDSPKGRNLISRKGGTVMAERAELDKPKGRNIYTENTTENTQEITTEREKENPPQKNISFDNILEKTKELIRNNHMYGINNQQIKDNFIIPEELKDTIDDKALTECCLSLLNDKKENLTNPFNYLTTAYKKIIEAHNLNIRTKKIEIDLKISEEKQKYYGDKKTNSPTSKIPKEISMSQYEGESLEEFEARCDQREAEIDEIYVINVKRSYRRQNKGNSAIIMIQSLKYDQNLYA